MQKKANYFTSLLENRSLINGFKYTWRDEAKLLQNKDVLENTLKLLTAREIVTIIDTGRKKIKNPFFDNARGKKENSFIRYVTHGNNKCSYCKEHDTTKQIKISVTCYIEFMLLFGVKSRNDLHPIFQNYLAHYYIPYSGNSILNNVNPLFSDVSDPYSEANPNGINIWFPYCGECYKKRFKKLPKQSIIHLKLGVYK